MSHITPRLNLPLIQPAQAQKHVTHNAALEVLDAISQLSVLGRDALTPPVSATEGDAYALGAAPSGDWANAGGHLAIYSNGGWLCVAPSDGWRLWDLQSAQLCVFANGNWQPVETDFQNISGLGVHTTSDAQNGLAVAAPAALLTHGGGSDGHQLKINKATATATASLLFQTGWSGRAEMGTMGSDGFSIKVSADGASFTQALTFDSTTGHATGAAIQSTPDDTTAGRLMRADFGYGPGNVIGPVSETAGLPTGAVIERGSTAQGDYVRFADGTQICTHIATVTHAAAAYLDAVWTFPMPFAQPPSGMQGTLSLDGLLTSATPTPDEIGATVIHTVTSSDCQTRQYRIAGAADFGAGDQASIHLQAIGRWF